MIIGLATIPLLSCILLALIPLSKLNRRIATVKNKIHSSLFWSQQIVLMNESYSMICMCTFINARHITFTSKCEIVNSVLTITFIILCTAMPLLISVFLVVKLPTLGSAAMKRKYGELTEGLDLEKGKVIVLTPVNFLLRRLLLVAVTVFNDFITP
jgi:hypothetical protein